MSITRNDPVRGCLRNRNTGPRAAAKLVALGMVAGALGTGFSTTVAAQTAALAGDAQLAQSQEVRSFAIPAQPLRSALDRFAEETGISFAYKTNDMSGIESPGVSGVLAPAQALQRLLAGTGVTYGFADTSSVVLHVGPQGSVITLNPVTVVGEKVERSYLDTPTSVGIVTGEDIATYNITDLRDSFNTMANVRSFSKSRGNNGFEIRGMNADGVTQPSNSAPLISVVIDGVTQSAEGLKRGSRGTWDIKQVEVHRGPASTLQGRAALAGAVVVETNDPTFEPEADAKAVYGNHDQVQTAFTLSAPIVADQLAFRIAGELREETKDIEFSEAANDPLGDDEYRNLRGKILLEPRALDDLSLLLTASSTFDKPAADAVSGPDFFARKFTSASSSVEFRQMEVNNYSADAAYEIGNALTLRSVSSLNKTELKLASAPSSASFLRDDKRRDDDFSQELRLEIDENDSGLTGVAGIFYGDFSQRIVSYIESGGFVFQNGTFLNETETAAVYADLRYPVYGDVSILAGGRFQHDTVHNFVDNTSDFGSSFSDREVEFDVFLPKLGLSYELDDTQTVAATASRGYRQGFSEIKAGAASEINAVEPEYLWTYELSYRHASADGRLTLGANAFFNDYKDHQISVTDPAFAPLANTQNGGDSESFGAEIEGRYDFGNGWNLFGALGLIRTEFGSFEDNSCSPSGGNCEGNEFPEAPSVTGAIGGVYRHQSGAYASGSVNYTGDYFTAGEINNRAQFELESRYIANVKVGYETENVIASLFVDNLFDKQYLTGLSTTSDEASIGDGRMVGAELRVRF